MNLLTKAPAKSKGGRWNLEKLPNGTPFNCISGNAVYAKHTCGAVVRVDKDRRSVKERKAAKRAEREAQQ